MHLFIGSVNFTQAPNFASAVDQFLADRSLVWNWISAHWETFSSWLQEPQVYAIIFAWWITFTVVVTLLYTFGGFGPGGIAAGSVAAGFQSWMYGGFTPAGGIFATLTSVAMLTSAMPIYGTISIIMATIVAVLVWVCGAGT